MSPDPIREPVLRELVHAAGAVFATILGRERGFALEIRSGSAQWMLVTSRGKMRLFASLNTASAFVRDLGIERFEVDMKHYQPGRLRAPRPDRAEALRLSRTKLRQQSLELHP